LITCRCTDFSSSGIFRNAVLCELAPDIQWIESYISDDKLFCIYLAVNEDIIRKHAEMSGFPATKIHPISRMIDPTTAQSSVGHDTVWTRALVRSPP
jgi:hypothetical protein